jgi:hypothetical protein
VAPVCGNKKNKEIVSDVEPQIHDGIEFVVGEPQTSKDAELETDFEEGFENPFA